MMRTCHGLGCTSTELIEAHIIPQSFARDIRDGSTRNFRITRNKATVAKQQLGNSTRKYFAPNATACWACLMTTAARFAEILRAITSSLRTGLLNLRNIDGDHFAKFVLAILWRASISKRPGFASVKLGPCEASARDVLFGAKPLSALPEYQLIIERYQSSVGDPSKFYFHPYRLKKTGTYGFGLAGFRMTARFGKGKPLADVSRGSRFAVAGSNVLHGYYVEFETAPGDQQKATVATVSGSAKFGFSPQKCRLAK